MLPTLDARLTAAAQLVRPGQPVADIGCDHGKLTAVLAASGKYPKVIGADLLCRLYIVMKDITNSGTSLWRLLFWWSRRSLSLQP